MQLAARHKGKQLWRLKQTFLFTLKIHFDSVFNPLPSQEVTTWL